MPNGSCSTEEANINTPPNSPACARDIEKRSVRIGCSVGTVAENKSVVRCPSASQTIASVSSLVRVGESGAAPCGSACGFDALMMGTLEGTALNIP
jgi:hypothetical protein